MAAQGLEIEGWGEYRKLILAELERLSRGISEQGTRMEASSALLTAKIEASESRVLLRFESFRTDEVGKLREEIGRLRVQVGMLQVKSGVWGLLGGAIPVVIFLIFHK